MVTHTDAGGGGTATAYATATASINQSIDIVNQDVQPLADAVQQGIKDASQQASQIATDTAKQISDSINGYTNSLFGWVKSIGEWLKTNIGAILSDIGKAFEKIGTVVYNAVKDAVTGIKDVLTNTLGPMLTKIGNAVQSINTFYQQHIQPILSAISQAQRTVAAAVTAIETDLKSGLKGILNLPTDVSNALTGLDASLQRAAQAASIQWGKNASDVTGYGKDHPMSIDLGGIHDSLKGFSQSGKIASTYAETDKLSDESFREISDQAINLLGSLLKDVLNTTGRATLDTFESLTGKWSIESTFFPPLLKGLLEILMLISTLPAAFEPLIDAVSERARERIPITKLDSATTIEALRREFLSEADALRELRFGGLDATRSQVLRDLAVNLADTQQALEWWWRDLITDDDLRLNMKQHGIINRDIDLYKAGSAHLFDPSLAILLWRRGKVTDEQLGKILDENRITDAEKTALMESALRPLNMTEAIQSAAQESLREQMNFGNANETIVPQWFLEAAAADGVDDKVATAVWTNHWQYGSPQQWIQMYFRGKRTLPELELILQRNFVPPQLWQDVIDANRPLIPFRQIPAMIQSGLISESEGLQRLQSHGYSIEDAVLLVKYATRGKKAAAAATAKTQQVTSMQTARTAFDDGLITEAQYAEVLQEHGLTKDAIDLEIKLAKITEETRLRKQTAQDIVNEFLAGTIDEATAKQQLAASGLTLGEQAKAQRQLRSAKTVKAKLPSEAELRAMAKKDVITEDDYETYLVQLGYDKDWAGRFRDLYFPSAAAASATP